MNKALARIVKHLSEQPGNVAPINEVALITGVSNSTIYRYATEGSIITKRGNGEVMLSRPSLPTSTDTHGVVRVKGGFNDADRTKLIENSVILNRIESAVERITTLIVAESNNRMLATKPAVVSKAPVEESDPLGEYKTRAMKAVKITKGLSWKAVEEAVNKSTGNGALNKLVFLMNLEHQFANDPELIKNLNSQLADYGA